MTDAEATWFGRRAVPVVPLVPVALFATALTGPIGANGTNGTRFRYSERRKRTLAAVHDHRLCRPDKPATGTNDAIGTGFGYRVGRMSIAATVRDRSLHRSGEAPTGTNDTIGTGKQDRTSCTMPLLQPLAFPDDKADDAARSGEQRTW